MDRQQDILRAIASTSQYLSDIRNLEKNLPVVLATLGRAVHVRRVYIYENQELPDGRLLFNHRLGWSAYRQNIARNIPRLQDMDYLAVGFARWLPILRAGRPVYGHVDEFDPAEVDLLRKNRIHSIAIIPIVNGEQWWGMIGFDDYARKRPWTAAEIDALVYVGRAIGTAFEAARLFRAEAQRRREAEILYEVSGYLTQFLDLDAAINQGLDVLLRHLTGELSLSLTVLDPQRQELTVLARRSSRASSKFDWVGQRISLDTVSVSRMVLETKRPYMNAALADQDVREERARRVFQAGLRAVLYLPLLVRSQAVGLLHVDVFGHPRRFSADEITLCQGIANLMAAAIERNQLLITERQQLRLAQTLQQVGALLTTQFSLEELYQKIFDLLTQVVAYDSASIQLFDEKQDRLVLAASQGFPDKLQLKRFIYSIGDHCLSKFQDNQSIVFIPDTRDDPRWINFPETSHILSWAGALLRVKGRIIGILNVDSQQVNAFNDRALDTITAFANQAAVAIENASLYTQLHEQSVSLAREVEVRTQELQSEKDRTLTILESAGESIIVTDRKAKIIYANRAAEIQSGYTRVELLGQTPQVLESGLTPYAKYIEMRSSILQGQQWSGELVYRRKNGTLYDVSVTVSPIMNNQREIVNFVILQADITRLKELDRLKTEFVTNVSHELRTPLTNIKTYVTLLEMGRHEKWEQYLKVVHHETDRLTQLIQDLLDLSRLETETPRRNLPAVSLDRVFQEYVDIFAAKAEIRQIVLHKDVPLDLPFAQVEERHLGQLLTNLLGNAIAYTPAGGHIWLKAGADFSAAPVMIWFQVVDTGLGVPEEDMPFVFDRFFRSEVVVSRGIPGTGLGLAICQEIVRRYSGRIDVSSVANQGTTFTVWLPAATAHAASRSALL